ncbi:hypothetical protein [Kribbella sp. NPDC000426]|uniref:hypothetical protein n=1 Tax=Kribbella sp. NPDC000426 TaxID=3154255 RepID=UPI00331F9F15
MERKVFCASGPNDVYRAVSTSLGRERFWATSAPESGGVISFVLGDGRTGECRIEEAVQDERYRLQYFGSTLTFALAAGETGGTELTLSSTDPGDCAEVVSLLLRLKAFVDFGVDLRSHDETRGTSYADS